MKNVSYASDVLKEKMEGTGEEIERVEKEKRDNYKITRSGSLGIGRIGSEISGI